MSINMFSNGEIYIFVFFYYIMVSSAKKKLIRKNNTFLVVVFLVSFFLFVLFAYSLYSYDLVLLSPGGGNEKLTTSFVIAFFVGLIATLAIMVVVLYFILHNVENEY